MSVKLTVLVDDAHRERAGEVADALRAAGMQVEQQLQTIGVITGSIAAERVGQLSEVPGVANVEFSQDYQLPPSDSELQ